MRVDWDKLSSQTYEDMVTVLLSRIHPESQRVDGAGGDGGRDFYFDRPDGRSVFQLKSFTGRMTRVRRRQVERSLHRLSRLVPTEWALVVPIDPTPNELEWFESLCKRAPFPLVWHGITWLDSEISSRPEIVRYFLEGCKDEVIALLIEMNKEQAALQSVGEAVKRLHVIHERLNELDPYYRYDFSVSAEASTPNKGAILSVSAEGASVYVYPRYADAGRDRPITANVVLTFGPEDRAFEEAFLRAMDYGSGVSIPADLVTEIRINAPGGLDYAGAGSLELSEAEPVAREPQVICADILEGDRLLAGLPINLRVRHAGQKGGVLEGDDDTHWLRVNMEVDAEAKHFTFTFHLEPGPIRPAAILPLLKWLTNFRPPFQIGLRLLSAQTYFARCPIPLVPTEGIERLPIVYEALDAVQKETGSYFPVPVDLSGEEVEAILRAHSLLSRETVNGSWSCMDFKLVPRDPEELRSLLLPEGAQLFFEEEQWLEVRGYRAPLGTIRTHFPSARAADGERLIGLLASEACEIALRLVPAQDGTYTQQRASPVH